MNKLTIFTILILSSVFSPARPISYEDGWTVMTRNNWFQSILHIHYSPSVNNSIGAVYVDMREDDIELAGLQWNNLLYRKNTKKSQTNLYLMSQAGGTIDSDSQLWGSLSLAGDWETRRYFASYRASGFHANDVNNGEFSQSARVGITPYLGNYGDLHTWLMLQVDHRPERSEDIVITPLVRLFMGIYLAEFGINNNGDVLFNAIIRL